MHFNFDFSAGQILWALMFAGQLVLLVVLLGRERIQRFPWFTASIMLLAVRLLAAKLLAGRMAPITLSGIFITLGDLMVVVSLLVLVEQARRAFGTVNRRTWIAGTLVLVAIGAGVLSIWGKWPAWSTLTANSHLAALALMQLAEQKGELLANVLAVELGLLVVVFGRRFKAGWRSHTQQIVIGLSTAAIAQMALQGIWELIVLKAVPHSQAEYDRILGLREKLYSANEAIYVAVLIWWIVCLWIDAPGTGAAAAVEATAEDPAESPTETPVEPGGPETVDSPAESQG
jgi:hypothetical protein